MISDVSAIHGEPARTRRTPWVVWLVLWLLVLILAWWFPTTGDDWRRIDFPRRTPAGFLAESVAYYQNHNGRAVANTVSYLLMEPQWLRELVRATTVVALVAGLHRVTGGRTAWGVLFCFAGVLLLPAPVFRESLGWATGFFHYAPPMIGVVLLVGTLAGRWPRRSWSATWWAALVCAVIGMLTCLFIEHVTVATVVLAGGGLGLVVAAGSRPSRALVGWAAGTLAGTGVMLLSPGMRLALSGDDPYYSRTGTLLDTVVSNYAVVTQSFVLSSPVVLGLVVLTCVACGLRGVRRRATPADVVLLAGSLLVGAYAVVSRTWLADRLACTEASVRGCDLAFLGLDLGLLILLLVVLVTLGLRSVPPGPDRVVWAGMLAATLLMLGPLLVVQPIGPRNLFGPLVTVVGMVAVAARPWTDGRATGARAAHLALLATVVTGLAWLGVVQWSNAQASAARVTVMEAAVEDGRRAVVLPAFPYPDWVHGPEDGKMGDHYFLERRRDIRITFAD